MTGFDFVPDGQKNVGGYDRLARVVAGIVLLVLAAVVYTSGQPTLALVSVVGAGALFLNAATQFCGINAMLGIDTCSRGADGDC